MNESGLQRFAAAPPPAGAAATPARVYVVVLNWNGSGDTERCVRSLLSLNHPNFCVVVCDNQSSRSDLAETRRWGATLPGGLPEFQAGQSAVNANGPALQHLQVVLIHTGGNLGFAGGVNVGLRFASAQDDMSYTWILNNDTVADSNALTALVQRMAADPSVGICGSTLVYDNKRNMVQALGGASYRRWRARSSAIGAFTAVSEVPEEPAGVEALLDYVNGASMLVSRDFLKSVGPMDESYFLYSEEHDWAYCGRQLGFRLGYAPKSLVFHKHGATIGTAATGGSNLSLYYLYRNKAMFAAKHHPMTLPIALPSLAWDGIKFLLKGRSSKCHAVMQGLSAFLRGRTGNSYSS